MPTGVSIGLGVGITLGVLILLAIILVIIGVCTSNTRTRDFSRERQLRLERVRERHQQEQNQWRERRLRDVVLLLIERGEAVEGVPLAFQLPNRPEVGARRALRSRRGAAQTQRQLLEIELANQDENSRLDPEALVIARKPLEDHLAHGRPEEADPGPDVMQLLLDGQEIQQHTSSEDDTEFLLDGDEVTTASVTPSLSPQGGAEARNGGTSVPPTPPLQAQPPATPPPPIPQSGTDAASPSTETDAATAAANSAADAEMAARTAAALQEEQRRRTAREKVLLHELHREKRRKRRKTAEELYGEGVEYEHNPVNDFFLHRDEPTDPAAASVHSPLWRFLTPLTPFRGNRTRGKKSAFEGRSPEETHVAGGPSQPGSPQSTKKGRQTTGASPF